MGTPPAGHPPRGGWPERSGAGRSEGAIHPKGDAWPPSDCPCGTREILRQRYTLGRSQRAIAQSLGLGLSHGAVGTTVLRAEAAGLDWAQVDALSDEVLEGRLYGRRDVAGRRGRPEPDCAVLRLNRVPNPRSR